VISQPVHIESDCDLDFTGRDVTIGPSGALIQQGLYFNNISIEARSLKIEGSIQVTNDGYVAITVDDSFTTSGDPGVPHIAIRPSPTGLLYGTGDVEIVASGNVTLAGSPISVTDGEAHVGITGQNINIGSPIYALGGPDGDTDTIYVAATDSIQTSKLVQVKAGVFAVAFVTLSAASGDVTVGGPIQSLRWANGIEIDAGGNVTLNAPIKAGTDDGGGNGQLDVQAGKDIVVNANIDLRGYGQYGNEGLVSLNPGPTGNVSIAKKIDVRGRREDYFGGIDANACAMRVSNRLLATGYGIFLSYRSSFDATGSSLRSFNTQITCPCVDTNGDFVCDTGCNPAPVGLNLARAPRATITPSVLQPCS
jgi:hypothetical protein